MSDLYDPYNLTEKDSRNMKYAGIYTDEGLIVTEFCDTEKEAWQQLIDSSGETKYALESAHYVQGFTEKEIEDLPEVDL